MAKLGVYQKDRFWKYYAIMNLRRKIQYQIFAEKRGVPSKSKS